MSNYVSETRESYRDLDRARCYRDYYSRGLSWMRLVMNVERRLVGRWLRARRYDAQARLLDLPCGTGLLGGELRALGAKVAAGDIAGEMMALAREEYAWPAFMGFFRGDVLQLPFPDSSYECVITLGLLHRMPADLRARAIREICRVSRRDVVVSFSIASVFARIKRRILEHMPIAYGAAPAPAHEEEILACFTHEGFVPIRRRATIPVLSSDTLLFFERRRVTGCRQGVATTDAYFTR